MSNPLKKTMVFLGLAEEDLEEQNSQAQQAPATPRQTQSTAPAQSPRAEASKPAPQRASVTPLRRVTPTRAPQSQPLNEILTLRPSKYADAKIVGENFREGVPVIINLSDMGDADAKRLIDFASGLAMGLRGRIERVTSKVFLLTPEHIDTGSEEDVRQSDSGSFFVSPSA